MVNRIQFDRYDAALIEEMSKLYSVNQRFAKIIIDEFHSKNPTQAKDDSPLMIEPKMLMAKSLFVQGRTQEGIEMMNTARQLAVKYYKDDISKYLDFQVFFVTNSVMWYVTDEMQIDVMLKIIQECNELKEQRNKEFPLISDFQGDEGYTLSCLRVMLLNRTNRHEEFAQARVEMYKAAEK